ncbi:HNH endonuclease [Clostridium butyricum]|uniref:HNH endonuclease n=1 Tax=Clostridium butyricum TaxID=1492 RepID=UPI002ABDFB18|nr:HNH endonuclease [Clostridium butyricum]
MINVRKKISPKLRFEVLKRDNFTCRYCGRKSPNVELHCDHIYPVEKGGINSFFNLLTACSDCNYGKSGNELNVEQTMDLIRENITYYNSNFYNKYKTGVLKDNWEDNLSKSFVRNIEIIQKKCELLITSTDIYIQDFLWIMIPDVFEYLMPNENINRYKVTHEDSHETKISERLETICSEINIMENKFCNNPFDRLELNIIFNSYYENSLSKKINCLTPKDKQYIEMVINNDNRFTKYKHNEYNEYRENVTKYWKKYNVKEYVQKKKEKQKNIS